MTNKITENQCNVVERNGQLVFTLNSEILLPEDAPVRLTSAQLEELDYRKLYTAYSSRGRKSAADPRVMFKVMVYGYQCGIYSSRKLEEACRYRIDFRWLLEDEAVPDHTTFARFRTGRCAEAVEDLFYQYVRLLEAQGETDHGTVFIDGTKIESRASRYSFCWRRSIEKRLADVKAKVAARGFQSLDTLRAYLEVSSRKIDFSQGKGHRKGEEQKAWESLDELRQRWEKYEQSLAIMGPDRNSYSKTDHDATFMRMKEDHMRNGQLKPGYNVQIAVNSEYITGIEAFSDRTDYRTMVPFLEKLKHMHQTRYEEVTADAGYELLENYFYLADNGQLCFIKPQNHETQKKRSFRKQIGRIENMRYDEAEDCFICAENRRLSLRRECTECKDNRFITNAWYRCEDCTGCPQRQACCKAKDSGRPKEIRLQREFWAMRQEAEKTISSERGVYLRLCRSIQVEGAFGLLKNDFGFRRFLTSGRRNIRTELFFLALAFDLKKLWMKRDKGRLKTHLSEIRIA